MEVQEMFRRGGGQDFCETNGEKEKSSHNLATPAASLNVKSTLGRPHKFWLLRRALGQPFFPLPPRPRRLREKVLQGGANHRPFLMRHNCNGFPNDIQMFSKLSKK